jgi:hypothetical protein
MQSIRRCKILDPKKLTKTGFVIYIILAKIILNL